MSHNPLSDAEHIRARPGMYIGGLNPRGRRFMITGLADDLLNLPDAERPRITITFRPDGFVELDARGAAPELSPEDFVLHHGHNKLRNFAPDLFSFPITSALCDPLDVTITRAGHTWSQTFSRGVATGPLHQQATDQPSRTHLRLLPDPKLFKDDAPDFHPLCSILQALALFHPAATLTVGSQSSALRRDYHYPRGLLDYMHELEPTWWVNESQWGRCWSLDLTDGPDRIRVVILLRPNGTLLVHSFANGQRLISGTHIDGFRDALAELAKRPNAHPNPHLRPGDDPTDKLTVVFALNFANPKYYGSTKDCLTGIRPKELAYRATLEQLPAQMG
jgi:DNA gyrase/topoisomerase IV subunit B